ncbi:MAG TPA: invasion associated locus B family protein [Thermomicrobiales bacterium]|nr:invasion associated locus B family protein [Thermomicrobiales bacterium]
MYRVLLIRYFIPALAALAIGIPTAFAAGAAGLPGGATSLRETYQAWQVACAVQDKTKHCALLQQQTEKNGLKVLTIQLTPTADRGASGTLILPFGLLLSSGVKFQIDDKPAVDPLPFRTCLPAGCVVPLTFNAAILKMLRAGTVLKLIATQSANGQPFTFSVSLKGFAPALDRTRALLH